jgi:hypothetical protein
MDTTGSDILGGLTTRAPVLIESILILMLRTDAVFCFFVLTDWIFVVYSIASILDLLGVNKVAMMQNGRNTYARVHA